MIEPGNFGGENIFNGGIEIDGSNTAIFDSPSFTDLDVAFVFDTGTPVTIGGVVAFFSSDVDNPLDRVFDEFSLGADVDEDGIFELNLVSTFDLEFPYSG